MDGYEATRVVFSRIQSIDAENASKIMGYILIQDQGDKEMIRLAFGPETVIHSVILKARKELNLNSPTNNPSSPSPSPPCPLFSSSSSSLSRQSSSSRLAFNTLPLSAATPNLFASGRCWNPICDDLVDEFQVQDQLSFLNDGSPNLNPKSSDLIYPQKSAAASVCADSMLFPSYWAGSVGRRCSDVSGLDDQTSAFAWRPCLYFARGFCKNGSNCKFLHNVLAEADGAAIAAGLPSSCDFLTDQFHELLRSKTGAQHRVPAASQLMGSGSFYSLKCMNLILQQQQIDNQRAAMALMMNEDNFHKIGRSRLDRNDLFNPASRQIYLTFPADSTFREEDVSNYFSIYGPVQDVRIPYQQKRMFGFVTFVYPETVKIILAKGNPHFVCDARVLVKPYKEKGKIPDRKQQMDRGELSSSCGLPTAIDSREHVDSGAGPRMFYNCQDIWRRNLEEQTQLDFQTRRMMGLQLLDDKQQHFHGDYSPTSSTHKLFNQSIFVSPSFPNINPQVCTDKETSNAAFGKESAGEEVNSSGKQSCIEDDCSDGLQEILDHNLPDSPFASSAEFSGRCFGSSSSSSTNHNSSVSSLLSPPASSPDVTSFKTFNCQLPRFSSAHGGMGIYSGSAGPTTCPVGI